MGMSYRIDTDNRVVHVRGEGSVFDVDMIGCIRRLRADADLEAAMPTLCDMRGIQSKVTRAGFYDLVGILDRTAGDHAPAKAAILVDDPLSFGMGRMLSALAENVSPECRVFEDEDAAHVWLSG